MNLSPWVNTIGLLHFVANVTYCAWVKEKEVLEGTEGESRSPWEERGNCSDTMKM